MRYYSYNEYTDNDENEIITLSEEDIRKNYWPYWYDKMCGKFGKEIVDRDFCFEDCLYDWVIVNWAWEVKDVSNS